MVKNFKDAIMYEIYPNNFCDSNGDGYGDIQGIISKLDYVKSMGFNGIWLNPIFESPFLDGGYDISNFYKISPRFGTMEDFEQLVSEIHKRDMILFLDLVPGHISIYSDDFKKSAESSPNEMSDTFIWTNSPWDWLPDVALIRGCYDRSGSYVVNFFAHQAAINYGYNEVKYPWQMHFEDKRVNKGREYIENVMKFWLSKGIDGFRVDMADSLVKNDDGRYKAATIKLWKKIIKNVKKDYPNFWMTSEWSNPDQSLNAGFDSDFVLDHHNNFSHDLFRSRDSKGNNMPLLHKYDEKLLTKFRRDIKKRCDVANHYKGHISVISGNHDTERLANFLTEDEMKLAYLFIMTMPGVPYVYAGDEISMKQDNSLPSIEGGYQRTGCRTPMRFDSSKNYGFSSSDTTFLPTNEDSSTVEIEQSKVGSVFNVMKDLIKIRCEESDLRTDEFKYVDGSAFSYIRGKLKVYINIKDEDIKIKIKDKSKVIYTVNNVEISDDEIVIKPHGGLLIRN